MPLKYIPPDYRTQRQLGSGQTSVVYLAEHPWRGTLALKLPKAELKERPVLWRMFENEVQITLNLNHENVVIGYDGHPTGEEAFLALEYCPGGTLDQLLLERGELPLEHAHTLVLDVAKGLDYCHKRQVLHRDVKPANVFLTEQGRAKLGDFGTGIYMTEPSTDRIGTAFYMAPEVFRGNPASIQSDIYSLGILAYEVITGERPFKGDSYDELMTAHLTSMPRSPDHYRPNLDKSVTKVLAKAMARDAKKRYSEVIQFIKDFSSAIGVATDDQPRFGRASRTRNIETDTLSDAEDVKAEERPKGFGRWFGKKKNN